jgi:hypothetical protein
LAFALRLTSPDTDEAELPDFGDLPDERIDPEFPSMSLAR